MGLITGFNKDGLISEGIFGLPYFQFIFILKKMSEITFLQVLNVKLKVDRGTVIAMSFFEDWTKKKINFQTLATFS